MSEAARFSDSSASPDLINAIMNIVVSGNPSGGDLQKLFRMYKSTGNEPDASFLRSADVCNVILESAFAQGHSVSLMDEKLWLLAYSAFWNKSNEAKVKVAKFDEKTDIENGFEMMKELSSLLEKITSMNQLHAHLLQVKYLSLSQVLNMIKEPICSSAILIWLKAKLFNDDFYEWTSLTLSDPAAFHVLDEIAVIQRPHLPRIFDIWISLFEREFDMLDRRLAPLVITQYREKFIDHFVILFNNHHEKAVLSYLASKVESIDPSLMIHFLNKVPSPLFLIAGFA